MVEGIKSPISRDPVFDIMKGIGILAIFLGHLTASINGLLFSFHVPLFFILSGYFFKYQSFKTTLQKDAFRLLVPYILTCLTICFIDLICDLLFHRPVSFSWIIASIFGSGSTGHTSAFWAHMPAIGAIWFLLALFWCKLLFALILRIFRNNIQICISVLLVSITATAIDRLYINLPFAILPGASALIFFGGAISCVLVKIFLHQDFMYPGFYFFASPSGLLY